MADCDYVIVGSGFGGAVSALRLVEKGYRVTLLEQGERVGPSEMFEGRRSLTKLIHAPAVGAYGYFSQRVLRHLCVVAGVGFGGGSLVYGAVLLKPRAGLFDRDEWRACGIDWKAELEAPFAVASRMLGATESPYFGAQDEALQRTARALGVGSSFGPVGLGIHFGERGVERSDPYFDGRGPARTGCRLCGECMIVGCPHGSKNSLDKNYLHLAESRGLRVLTGHRATEVVDRGEDGVEVCAEHTRTKARLPAIRAKNAIIACGVLGTVELLLRSRERGGLPRVSAVAGEHVRTNSEALLAVVADDERLNLAEGPAISSRFFLEDGTHITQNRFATGQDVMRWQLFPMVESDEPPSLRARLAKLAGAPRELLRLWTAKNWHGRLTLLAAMQEADNELALRWRSGVLGSGLQTELTERRAPATIPEANRAARAYAEAIQGKAYTSFFELAGMSVTAHILGGAVIGRDASTGVIDADHRLFGHPNVRVIDASAVPGNVGVNPSLTITAMAERALSRIQS